MPNHYCTQDRAAVTCGVCVLQVEPPSDDWSCKFCGVTVGNVDVCRGCGAAVCENCDQVPLKGGLHLAKEHRRNEYDSSR